MAVSVFLFCIITKPTLSWPHLYLDWIQRTFWMHTRKALNTLVSKGYTPKNIIMDNQSTKVIKSYLTPQQCRLQLDKPGNHWVNAAEHAIQTFKNCFIGALGMTDIMFLSSCGTRSSHHRCKTPSTSYGNCGSTLTYQHMRHSGDHTNGIVSLLHPSEQRQ